MTEKPVQTNGPPLSITIDPNARDVERLLKTAQQTSPGSMRLGPLFKGLLKKEWHRLAIMSMSYRLCLLGQLKVSPPAVLKAWLKRKKKKGS